MITLDTVRADFLGSYGGRGGTPRLDGVARRGVRFERALSPAPLTLPAHATILTGFDPPEHGVRDNGIAALGEELETLATALAARGFDTAAFVGSLVLDRRFGLARGFDVYDDRMSADEIGEAGYPERNARAVSDAALAWWGERDVETPAFLWVHYYDAHAPYDPPSGAGSPAGGSPADAYAAEIAFVDQQMGRLLDGLGVDPQWLVAVVGDHGEMLGEHGEDGHGIFLYEPVLRVPLILAGDPLKPGVVKEPVGLRSVAPSLWALIGGDAADLGRGTLLPGLGLERESTKERGVDHGPFYHEARLPASAYGWSALQAVSDERWRLVVAPEPELYDLVADPRELNNRFADRRPEARRLEKELRSMRDGWVGRRTASPGEDAEVDAALRSLGYLSGQSSSEKQLGLDPGVDRDGIDPKRGIQLLDRFEQAKALASQGRPDQALPIFEGLIRESPRTVAFHNRYGSALMAVGRHEQAVAALRRAVELNPRLDFLHARLGEAFRRLGRFDEAAAEYRATLALNPRFAGAWLGLAEIAARAGKADEELKLLREAHEAGTDSAALLLRLAMLESSRGNGDRADSRLERALELQPDWVTAWTLAARVAASSGNWPTAVTRFQRAAELAPRDPKLWLELGKAEIRLGRADDARRSLERAADAAPGTAIAAEAARLVSTLARRAP